MLRSTAGATVQLRAVLAERRLAVMAQHRPSCSRCC